MKRKSVKYLGLPVVIFFIVSCAVITVNIYFPTEAVEMAAEKIIDEIEGGEESDVNPEVEGPQSLFLRGVPRFTISSASVYAEEIDLNITTPAIRKVIDSMKARNPEIMLYKDMGVIGESHDGIIVIRDIDGLGGNDIRTIKRLLRADNADREILYTELAAANKITTSEIGKIKTIFAKARKEKAKSGHWFKDDAGTWTQK
ncbi:MAG: YdbL family protein [Planctomycetes bacterium]|nr:YdbL family protein [Planctomycetota bacterium]